MRVILSILFACVLVSGFGQNTGIIDLGGDGVSGGSGEGRMDSISMFINTTESSVTALPWYRGLTYESTLVNHCGITLTGDSMFTVPPGEYLLQVRQTGELYSSEYRLQIRDGTGTVIMESPKHTHEAELATYLTIATESDYFFTYRSYHMPNTVTYDDPNGHVIFTKIR